MYKRSATPEELQALAYLEQHPAKYGTLMVTCKGIGYGGIARDTWKAIIEYGWVDVHSVTFARSKRLRPNSEGQYVLKNGRTPPGDEELNRCPLCKGGKGWKGVNYFVPCSMCDGTGLYAN